MVVFDTTFLRLLLRPDADPPADPSSGRLVTSCQSRIEYLIESLESDGETIVVPTPALAELLVVENKFGPDHMTFIDKHGAFNIVPFDRRAAVEHAEQSRSAITSGDKKGGSDESWTKVKFDRQILAIAKVCKANTIYSDDDKLRKAARKAGLAAIGVHELPVKPDPPQHEMDLDTETD